MKKSGRDNKTKSFIKQFKTFMTPARNILFGFIALILLGTLLLALPAAMQNGESMGFVSALFMATSSVCVTGLAVVDLGSQASIFGQIVTLILIQAGGLGFMTTTTMMLLLVGKKFSLRYRMNIQESLSQEHLNGVVKTTKNILKFTFLIEATGALILAARFVPLLGPSGLWVALFMSVSAFCNAGLDILGDKYGAYSSIAAFQKDPVVTLTIAALIVVGGLGFVVFSDIFGKRKNTPLSLHTKLALGVTLFLLLCGTALFLGLEYDNPATIGKMNFGDKLMNAFFQSVTTRTAGFSTINQSDLFEGSKVVSIILMFIGASPASTGGGVKTTTLFVMFMLLVSVFRDEDDIVINKKTVSYKITRKAGALIILALLVVMFQSMAIWIVDVGRLPGMNFLDCAFESVSAFGTAGLSVGVVASLSAGNMLTMCLTMFTGRLGPIMIGSAIMRGGKNRPNVKYPKAKILIG